MKRLIVTCLGLVVAGAMSVRAASTKAIFQHDCAKCHGRDGKGHTPMGRILHINDFTHPQVQKQMKDAEMVKAIKEGLKDKQTGRKTMPPFGSKLTDAQIKSLLAYVRKFGKK